MNICHEAGNSKQGECKMLLIWTKGEEIISIFKENSEFSWYESLSKIDYFTYFDQRISRFLLLLLEPPGRFNQFSAPIFPFWREGTPAFPLQASLEVMISTLENSNIILKVLNVFFINYFRRIFLPQSFTEFTKLDKISAKALYSKTTCQYELPMLMPTSCFRRVLEVKIF